MVKSVWTPLYFSWFHVIFPTWPTSSKIRIGTLGDNDGDGYENVIKKVKSRCFKLYRALLYSILFNLPIVDKFFFRAQLFEGPLTLNPGLNLTQLSFYYVQKNFLCYI